MSACMLVHLTDVVASGTKTSTGFKKVHLNACARALNDHFKLSLTGDQIRNHVRYWKNKWQRITKLKHGISGALWDEENFIIGLHHDHYVEYIKVFSLHIVVYLHIVIYCLPILSFNIFYIHCIDTPRRCSVFEQAYITLQ